MIGDSNINKKYYALHMEKISTHETLLYIAQYNGESLQQKCTRFLGEKSYIQDLDTIREQRGILNGAREFWGVQKDTIGKLKYGAIWWGSS